MDALVSLLFKYPPRVWERGELVWSPVLPTWVIGALALAAVVAALLAYRRVRGVAGWERGTLIAIRTVLLAIIALCLLRPTLVVASAVPQRNILAVLLDDSRSMRIADGADSSRAAAVSRAFADSTALVQALAERFALRFYRFGADVRPAANAAGLRATGTRTDLAAALDGARTELAGAPLAGVIVVSDGADNGGSDLEPALLALRARRVPVHTVGVGLERFPRDVAIERFSMPARPLKGAALLADVTLRLRGVAGEKLALAVESDGRVVSADTITLPRTETARARLRVADLEAGIHRVTVRAQVLARETVAENNEAHTMIQVRPGPDRILYMEGEPRYELPFIRRAVASDSALQLVTLLRSAEKKFLRLGVKDSLELVTGFPATREELFGFRGIILGSIEASYFAPDQLRMLAEFVSQRGGGLLALGGRNALAEGGFRGTPVAEVLPIALDRAPVAADGPATEMRLRPTAAGRDQPAMQIGANDAATARKWDSLPPLTIVNGLGSLRPGATAWLTGRSEGSSEDRPLLATQRFGRGTATVFGVQDSFLWRMHADIAVEDHTHETLWRQLARALTEEAPERVEIAAVPSRVAPGEPVAIKARIVDERFNDVNDAAVQGIVTSPSGRVTEVPLEWTLGEDGAYAGRFVAEEAGVYHLSGLARRGRDTTRAVEGAFLADDQGADVEQAELRAPLLRRIAERTGGRYHPLADAAALAEDVKYTEGGVTMREVRDLWDMPIVFLLVAALLAGEWGLRRSRGLA